LSLTGHDATATPTNTRYARDLAYTPLGQLTHLRHSNGVADDVAYDPTRHWLDSIEVTGSESLYDASYRHHPDGKLGLLTERQPGARPLEQQYDYDDLGRLTSVRASDPSRNRDYSYDDIGRMTSSSTAGTYSYDDPDHLHAPTSTSKGHSRGYDANGNLTSLQDPRGRDLTIDWTGADMPEHITDANSGAKVAMGYDAADQRVVKKEERRTTHYFGRYLEQNPRGRLVKHYWAGTRLIARRDGEGKLTHVHQDRLGSTRLLTDGNGKVLERYEYDPFGKPLNPPARDERLWQGERLDHDSGLVYMNARFYDPELGRFISPDSIVPDPYRPQSLDRYAYVENDPTNNIDPTGHIPMQVELRKEQAAESSWGAMYARSLTAGCGPWSVQQCVPITSSTIITEKYDSESGELLERTFCTYGECVSEDKHFPSSAEVAESDSATAAETAEGEPVHSDIGETVARGPSAESGCSSCTLLAPEPSVLDTIRSPQVMDIEAAQAAAAGFQEILTSISEGLAWLDKKVPNLLEGIAAVPGVGGLPGKGLQSLRGAKALTSVGGVRGLGLISRMAHRMRLDYQIYRGTNLIKGGTIFSGRGGPLGHAEIRFLLKHWDVMRMGDEVILVGSNAICGHGICRPMLDYFARQRGVNFLYHGFTPGPSLTFFQAGVGHVKAPRIRLLP
jgi:RHS repeat-associated protein